MSAYDNAVRIGFRPEEAYVFDMGNRVYVAFDEWQHPLPRVHQRLYDLARRQVGIDDPIRLVCEILDLKSLWAFGDRFDVSTIASYVYEPFVPPPSPGTP